MHKFSSSTPLRDSSTHERAIEALARQAQVPVAHVAQLYERELAALTVGARLTGFLPILTIRRVRDILRQHSYAAYMPEAPAHGGGDAGALAQSVLPDRTERSAVRRTTQP